MLERINAKTKFFFLRHLKMKPAANPASVHFVKQAKKVPTTLIGMNKAIVDGDKRAITPLKKPTIAPEAGPAKTAAMTTATSDKLILTDPNCK